MRYVTVYNAAPALYMVSINGFFVPFPVCTVQQLDDIESFRCILL